MIDLTGVELRQERQPAPELPRPSQVDLSPPATPRRQSVWSTPAEAFKRAPWWVQAAVYLGLVMVGPGGGAWVVTSRTNEAISQELERLKHRERQAEEELRRAREQRNEALEAVRELKRWREDHIRRHREDEQKLMWRQVEALSHLAQDRPDRAARVLEPPD